jgi:coenzyme Q-binding protein COQ10
MLFDIVADVERYPEFVPGCLSARILERQPDRWLVDNVFGFGPMRSRFHSTAEPDSPSALTIRSRDGPWREFLIRWRFHAESGGCLLSCEATLDFRSPLLAGVASLVAAEVERRVIAAFQSRALRLAKGGSYDG